MDVLAGRGSSVVVAFGAATVAADSLATASETRLAVVVGSSLLRGTVVTPSSSALIEVAAVVGVCSSVPASRVFEYNGGGAAAAPVGGPSSFDGTSSNKASKTLVAAETVLVTAICVVVVLVSGGPVVVDGAIARGAVVTSGCSMMPESAGAAAVEDTRVADGRRDDAADAIAESEETGAVSEIMGCSGIVDVGCSEVALSRADTAVVFGVGVEPGR
jgi:hypothetical protein